MSDDIEKLDLPSASDVLKQVTAGEHRYIFETNFEKRFSARSVQSETDYAHLRGIEDHYKHKKHWSWFVIFIMFLMVGFQMVLIVKVGRGTWDYKDYDWLLPTLMIQYFGQIVGLAWLIVKSLFSKINN